MYKYVYDSKVSNYIHLNIQYTYINTYTTIVDFRILYTKGKDFPPSTA